MYFNQKLNNYINDHNLLINQELNKVIISLEKNSDMSVDHCIRDKYTRKYLVPLLQNINLFKQDGNTMKVDEIKYIAEHMKFQFLGPGENVFEYNDFGNLFYIIIEGTCSI